jgi:cell division protein FtsB
MLIHLELRKEIKKLEEQKDFLRDQINQDKALIESLSNPRELEKFARETYFLKKEDEEIYLIEFQDSINSKSRD